MQRPYDTTVNEATEMTCEECDGEDECYDDCRCEDCIQAGIDRMESMNDID